MYLVWQSQGFSIVLNTKKPKLSIIRTETIKLKKIFIFCTTLHFLIKNHTGIVQKKNLSLEISSTHFTIKGRDVTFQKACGQVVDCEFEELCGRPLWTNDYLKMANIFHTVFIRNIPIMNMKTKSEARRFITLIDTLYDNRVRVIASAQGPYWDLFRPETKSEQDKLDENRMLIDDLGIRASSEGSLDAGVFSGEEELFAFDRTTSRMTEMQSKDYWGQWEAYMANKSYKTTSDHHQIEEIMF